MNKMIRLRRVLNEAQDVNSKLGHENLGFLSEEHGFIPAILPLESLPKNFQPWDDVSAHLPELISTLTLRNVVDRLPILSVTEENLPDPYLCRAALVLCNIAHSYYWVEVGSKKTPPSNVLDPWTQVSRRLGRPHPSLLALDILYNWRLLNPKRPDPMRVDNIELLALVAGNQEETIEFRTALEMMMQTKSIVSVVVRAHEAVVAEDQESLKQELLLILERIQHVTEVTYTKIDLNPHSATYVDPSLWGKTTGGGYFSGPIHPDELGMSGAGYPIFPLMDIFLGRKEYSSSKGKEALAIRHWFPQHLHQFFSALEDISVRDFVLAQGGRALQNVFQQLVDAYAGEKGFLGVHRLKTYGFMEVGFKTGRAVTNGGFKSLDVFREKTWEQINDELEIARNERYKGLPAHCFFASPRSTESIESNSVADVQQIDFDISGSNICYKPGDRCAILPENSDMLVEKTINALQAASSTPIALHRPWQSALQLRAAYQNNDTLIKTISLYDFLKFAKIRPVTRITAKRVLAITASQHVEKMLRARAEDQWELWDLFEVVSTEGFDIGRFWRAKPWEAEALCRIISPETFRLYSITSTHQKKDGVPSDTLRLTVGQLTYQTIDSDVSSAAKRYGTASNYLHRMAAQNSIDSNSVSFNIVPAARFRLPADDTRPIVMFAAGTGIAPFLGFIEERARKECCGDNWLFFSIKTSKEFHGQNQLATTLAANRLKLQVAFSREDISAEFIATQQGGKFSFKTGQQCRIDTLLLQEGNAQILWELIQCRNAGGREAYFYICGNTGFAVAVMDALKRIIQTKSGKTENEADQIIYALMAERRLMKDIFTTYSVPVAEEERTFNATEVATHNNDEFGYWMIINGRVYDLTKFIHMHPGGHHTLMLNCGLDATQSYRNIAHSDNTEIEAMLGMYEIGVIKRLNFQQIGGVVIGPDGPFYITLDEVFHAWVRYLHLVIEMQNALKVDFTFLEQATTGSEAPHEFSLFKASLFIQAHKRFQSMCIDILMGDDLHVLWAITSGLCDRHADVTWMRKSIEIINEKKKPHDARECMSVLHRQLEEIMKYEDRNEHGAVELSLRLKTLCFRIRNKNEQLLTALKRVVCDGVNVFEFYEAQSIKVGGSLLLQNIMRVPWVLEHYYETIWYEIVALYEHQYDELEDGALTQAKN